jgi:hypothetical protein
VPKRPVARLNVIKVSAVVPEARQASAQRVASKTDDVNSARANKVICDARLRIRILVSGVFDTKDVKMGFSRELLAAKKMVNVIQIAVRIATTKVMS